MTDDRDEREALRALASLLDLPPEPAARPLRPAPALPFEVPPARAHPPAFGDDEVL